MRNSCLMNTVLRLALLLMAFGACAHEEEEDEPIENASALRDWCKEESAAYFVAQGQTPYNWSASWYEEGNVLIAEGEWLLGHTHVAVTCRVAKGARRKYASYEVTTPPKP